MSFRNTYITEFLYKHGRDAELKAIKDVLEKYGTADWRGSGSDDQVGYFHGVIKDLDSYETKEAEAQIIKEVEEAGARIKIVFEVASPIEPK